MSIVVGFKKLTFQSVWPDRVRHKKIFRVVDINHRVTHFQHSSYHCASISDDGVTVRTEPTLNSRLRSMCQQNMADQNGLKDQHQTACFLASRDDDREPRQCIPSEGTPGGAGTGAACSFRKQCAFPSILASATTRVGFQWPHSLRENPSSRNIWRLQQIDAASLPEKEARAADCWLVWRLRGRTRTTGPA